MRQVIYGGAMSLDGYIAGPNGEYDWIVMDPDIDFAEMSARFDTFLIGRKTYDAMRRMGSDAASAPASRTSCSRARCSRPSYPTITLRNDAEREVTELRQRAGKDIALFGGGELFRSLLDAGLVDGSKWRWSRCSSAAASRCCLAGPARQAQAARASRLREDRHGRTPSTTSSSRSVECGWRSEVPRAAMDQ